ncbi:hypothetical protein C6984_11125, partial [Escherichia coli]
SELLLCHGMVCVVGRIRDLILQLSKSSIYSTKPLIAPREHRICTGRELHAQKTTRRWFHDTAYCFDYSDVSHGTRSGT